MNRTVVLNTAGTIASIDPRYCVRVEEIRYYPPVFDFLLSLFPHTMTVKLDTNLPQQIRDQITGWIEFRGAGEEGTIRMLSHWEGNSYILEGVFRPPKSGTYQFRIILSIGNQQYVVEQGEREIIAPRPHERWTQGPLAIRIEEGLFLGNAAAAADPQFLEDCVHNEHDRVAQIAVVNASAEREPRPALLSAKTRRGTRFIYRQFPFTDFSHNPMAKEEIWKAVKWMHEQMKKGSVFVHCHAGIGRSASLIVAYLRLLRHPHKSYDEVIEMMKEVIRRENHDIFPHVGLPETLKELQEDALHQKELAALLGSEAYDYLEEPMSEVKGVSFADGYEVGQARIIMEGEEISVQARVDHEAAEPRGVFVHTNLSGENKEILMRRVGGNIYQAEVKATLSGDNFWLTVSATPRRYDHDVRRKWVGGNVYFNVGS